jgi:hypothetical protein
MSNSRRRREFGDFQTPLSLARQVCDLLVRGGLTPKTVVEPTCGQGSFLLAASEHFSEAERYIGVDINPDYVRSASEALSGVSSSRRFEFVVHDFFNFDWAKKLASCPEPLLIIGNPPWVTNSVLGSLRSSNLPQKSNFQMHRGIDAITGKANFDISEWMLLRAITWLDGKRGTLAMLCKTSTARKVLNYCWENRYAVANASIRRINAHEHFGAAVEACLLLISSTDVAEDQSCLTYDDLYSKEPQSTFGRRDGHLVADVDGYRRWRHCFDEGQLNWRSGIKHDCARVMELREQDGRLVNGLGEVVDVEEVCIFPMYKGSEISSGSPQTPRLWMIVPQRAVSDDTAGLREVAPKTWQYLLDHGELLDQRASSIYRRRPRFAIFGVGDYTFSEWKLAVSALYKQPKFVAIGPGHNRPVVLDDTCYFLACDAQLEAQITAELLNSPVTTSALSSRVFLDAKRPINVGILNQLDLVAIARELRWGDELIAKLPTSRTSPQTVFF